MQRPTDAALELSARPTTFTLTSCFALEESKDGADDTRLRAVCLKRLHVRGGTHLQQNLERVQHVIVAYGCSAQLRGEIGGKDDT